MGELNQMVATATQSIQKIVSRSGRTVKKNRLKGEDSEEMFLREIADGVGGDS